MLTGKGRAEMRSEVIRYSEAFKRQVIEEVEKGRFRTLQEVGERYGIGGHHTVKRWLKKYGKKHLLPRVVRVESMDEKDRIKQLKRRNKELEKALAETKVHEVLNQAYLELACEKYGEDVEEFKKKFAGQLYDEDEK
jgi:transposase